MRKTITLGAIIAASLLSAGVGAQTIYKSEKNGVTSYSTKPSPDSSAVKLPELSVIPGATGSSSNNTMVSMPSAPDSMIPGNNGNLLPPPPPSLGTKPATSSVQQLRSREELQSQLAKARTELAAQEEIRLGEERNYQKKIDRLKPYQNKIDELTKALGIAP
jgi:hypothetical protein